MRFIKFSIKHWDELAVAALLLLAVLVAADSTFEYMFGMMCNSRMNMAMDEIAQMPEWKRSMCIERQTPIF